MKARIPGRRALLKPDKQAVRDYVDQHQKDVTRRLLKLACVSLHLEFGFGKSRLGRFLMKMNGLMGDELLWWHIDKLLIDQVGLEFDREGERE